MRRVIHRPSIRVHSVTAQIRFIQLLPGIRDRCNLVPRILSLRCAFHVRVGVLVIWVAWLPTEELLAARVYHAAGLVLVAVVLVEPGVGQHY